MLPNSNEVKHDGSIVIAMGASRRELNWKPKDLLWSQLLSRFSRTSRTGETYADYMRMPKEQQDKIKDIGGFVGGTLSGGRRKKNSVSWRHVITLDADFVKGDLWSQIEYTFDFACCVYSTHKHSPEHPRLRLVIPLKKPVTPSQYEAVSRKLANDINIDFFDDTTYEPHRLMYWPSTSNDGAFFFEFMDEPWLDPGSVLSRYEDWTDSSQWPESSRVVEKRKREMKKQGDPLEKPGLIGAFCKTYRVDEAIETFLPEVYERVSDTRWTYKDGSTSGGLVLYEDGLFAYSHHGTDPIGGELVNAFDLVRVHKFGLQDEEVKPGTPVTKLPSFVAMQNLVMKDDEVKRTTISAKMELAVTEFQEEDDEDEVEDYREVPESAEECRRVPKSAEEDQDWLKRLEVDKNGDVKKIIENVIIILRHDPSLKGISFNALKNLPALSKRTPWRKPTDWQGDSWCDDDDAALRAHLEMSYGVYTPQKINDAFSVVSRERSFHPIREYLSSLPEWDGVPRVEYLFTEYLGADNTRYVREVTKKTLVAAVARVMRPGIKFDNTLVLIGPQGVGKSTIFQRLGGEWFSDSLTMQDTKDKTGAEKLQGYWIVEIGELAGIRKVEVESVKAFLSREKDIYRPAYGKRTIENPRQCIIVGSTNNSMGFLRDTTGNRRFWPINVKGVNPDNAPWNISKEDVGQIWAEALALYKAGEKLYLDADAAREALEAQRRALESDERSGMVQDYLDTRLPEDWDEKSVQERRSFFHGDFGSPVIEGGLQRQKTCAIEIWTECFNKDRSSFGKKEREEIDLIMQQMEGWERYEKGKDGKLKFVIYGTQRAYIRNL